jgi:STE24 endopeptidase
VDVGGDGDPHGGVSSYSVPVRLRLPIAIVAALVVAEAAVVLMRPRGLLEPLDAAPRAYFSAAQIERAENFRNGQLVIYVAQTALELAVLALVVWRPPRALLARRKRQVLTGAAAAAALSVTVAVVTLPFAAIARERAKNVGLVTQNWVGYAGDVAKSAAIGAVLAAGGGALLVFALRRFGRRWWAPAAAVVVAFGIVTTYLTPIVLDPLFNKFTPLPDGPTRSAVLDLARRAASTSARSTRWTARAARPRQRLRDRHRAHEARRALRHAPEALHARRDAARGRPRARPRPLPRRSARAPVTWRSWRRSGCSRSPGWASAWRRATPAAAAVPAILLAIAVMAPAITFISNQLSRAVEARADTFALQLTHDPKTFIGFQRRISVPETSAIPTRGGLAVPARHAPDHDAADRARAAVLGAALRRARRHLGQVLDALRGAPLGPVVLHRVDQLAHELGRQVEPGDDDAGHLALLDLVVHAGERDAELVVRVRDVGEVRVRPRHRLG